MLRFLRSAPDGVLMTKLTLFKLNSPISFMRLFHRTIENRVLMILLTLFITNSTKQFYAPFPPRNARSSGDE